MFYNRDALGQGITQAGSALGTALGQLGTEKRTTALEAAKRGKWSTALGTAIKNLGPNPTPQQFSTFLKDAIDAGVPAEMIKPYSDTYKPYFQQQAKTAGAANFMRELGLDFGDIQQPNQIQNQNLPSNISGQPNIPGQANQPQPSMIPGQANQPPQQNKASQLTNDQLLAMKASGYIQLEKAADFEINRRQNELKNFQEERGFHAKGAEKAQEEANTIRDSLRSKEMSLRLSREAIETGETGPVSWANIAQRLGVPEFMNAAGTQLNQAGKEFFFGNLMRVSAKAQNQWLEQRMTKLFADIGDPKINAMMKNTILEGETELNNAYLNSFDRLKNEDMQKYGYVKNDIKERAYKDSEIQSQKIMDKISFKTRELYEEEKGAQWLIDNAMKKVPKGTILTPKMIKVLADNYYDKDKKQALINAKKIGYRIPKEEELKSWL